MLISWSNSSIWTNSRISLFNRFICPFVQLLSLYDLFWYMKQISCYKFILKRCNILLEVTLMTLICRPISLFLWQNLISRRSFITTTKGHCARKTASTLNKKANCFLTNHQNKNIKILKEQHLSILQYYFHCSVCICSILLFTKTNQQHIIVP